MIVLLSLGSCVFVTAADDEARPRRADDLWVIVEDERGFAIPDAVGTFIDGPSARTNAAGEMVFAGLGGGTGHDLLVRVDGDTFTTGRLRVDPDRTSVATVTLGRRTTHTPRYPEHGAAFGVDGVYALVLPPPTADADGTVDWRWVDDGEALGPPKQDADGAPLDLIAILELDRADGVLPLTLRLDSADPRDLALYTFVPEAGAWVSQADVTRSGDYLLATLPTTGWWAIGTPSEGRNLPGLLVGLASRAEVRIRAADRPGAWRADGWPTGTFTLPVPLDTPFAVTARDVADGVRRSAVTDLTDTVPPLVLAVREDRDEDGYSTDPAWGGDCDDGDPAVHPGADDPGTDGDPNCDGVPGVDADHDGVVTGDCDPSDPAVHPGAPEICDTLDNDCDDRLSERDDGDPRRLMALDSGACAACDPSAVTRLDPTLYWRLDRLDRARDSSGFGRDGVIHGLDTTFPGITHWGDPALLGEPTPRFPGTPGNDVTLERFDGFGTGGFSVSLWVRPQYPSAGRALVSYAVPAPGGVTGCADAAPGSHEFALDLQGDELRVWIHDRSASVPLLEVPQQKWAHVVVTFSPELGGQLVAHVNDSVVVDLDTFTDLDGLPVGRPPAEGLVSGGRWVLGQRQRCAEGEDCIDRWSSFSGLLDEVAVFDRVLPGSEIEALFESATCGVFQCTGTDDDGDGVRDEHILGAMPNCPAESCADVQASGSFAGEGLYWLHYSSGPQWQRGTCRTGDSGMEEAVCGDRKLDSAAPATLPVGWPGSAVESCDERSATCDECVRDLHTSHVRSCAEVQQALGSEAEDPLQGAVDGPYWIEDPLETGEKLQVRCLLENDDGWTLVFFHEPEGGVVFVRDADADGLPDDREICSDPLDSDSDDDGLTDGQEVLFQGTDPCVADVPLPELIHGKSSEVPAQRANIDNPFSPAYSILDRLEGLRGTNGWEFRMVWPCSSDADPLPTQIWRQSWNPTDPDPSVPLDTECDDPSQPNGCFPGLVRRPYDEEPPLAWISRPDDVRWEAHWPQDPLGVYEDGLYRCEEHLLAANGKHVPPHAEGVGCSDNDQTVPSVELWVRPW